MAMNIGSSESIHGDPEVMMEINTTPLIDVMLVLLVMLIITIPIQLHSVNVEMPVQQSSDKTLPPPAVILEINANSQIFWNEQPMLDRVALEAKMNAEVLLGENQSEIRFMPNRAAKYEVVAGVMATAQRLGLQKIGLGNIPEFAAQVKAP